jgi:hypothetical protein
MAASTSANRNHRVGLPRLTVRSGRDGEGGELGAVAKALKADTATMENTLRYEPLGSDLSADDPNS